MYPSKELIKHSIPKAFKPFKNIRCSIDCTEFFFVKLQKTMLPMRIIFSNYKKHSTMKALIAVTPNGSSCFICDLYKGCISDPELTEQFFAK